MIGKLFDHSSELKVNSVKCHQVVGDLWRGRVAMGKVRWRDAVEYGEPETKVVWLLVLEIGRCLKEELPTARCHVEYPEICYLALGKDCEGKVGAAKA